MSPTPRIPWRRTWGHWAARAIGLIIKHPPTPPRRGPPARPLLQPTHALFYLATTPTFPPAVHASSPPPADFPRAPSAIGRDINLGGGARSSNGPIDKPPVFPPPRGQGPTRTYSLPAVGDTNMP